MNPRRTLATTNRVLRQLRHDPRTIALLLVVPLLLITLLKYVFNHQPATFNSIGPQILGLFPFIVMFLITSITMLRERTSGTLERLLALPTAKLDLMLGYALAFAIVAVIQAILAVAVAVGLLDLQFLGNKLILIITAALNALLGMSLGLFASAFAQTEFQAIQFMPAFIFPQLLLCGLFVARDQMPRLLEIISNLLPLPYAVDAMQELARHSQTTARYGSDLLVIIGFVLAALALGALTLRRQTD